MGRRYEIEEWVEFWGDGMAESEGGEFSVTSRVRTAADNFSAHANRVVENWMNAHPDSGLHGSGRAESEDDIAYNTWAHFEGEGVGFWEDMEREEYRRLAKALDKDTRTRRAYQKLHSAMQDSIHSDGNGNGNGDGASALARALRGK